MLVIDLDSSIYIIWEGRKRELKNSAGIVPLIIFLMPTVLYTGIKVVQGGERERVGISQGGKK